MSIVDGGHLAFNSLPPPLRIEQVTADRKSYDLDKEIKGRLELPSRVRDLEIDYTALSWKRRKGPLPLSAGTARPRMA